MEPICENYNDLAKAVVTQAVEDYKKALKEQKALKKKLVAVNKTLAECEKFFNSEQCRLYSDIDDSSYIIENAKKTAKQESNEEVITVSIRIRPKKD